MTPLGMVFTFRYILLVLMAGLARADGVILLSAMRRFKLTNPVV